MCRSWDNKMTHLHNNDDIKLALNLASNNSECTSLNRMHASRCSASAAICLVIHFSVHQANKMRINIGEMQSSDMSISIPHGNNSIIMIRTLNTLIIRIYVAALKQTKPVTQGINKTKFKHSKQSIQLALGLSRVATMGISLKRCRCCSPEGKQIEIFRSINLTS